MKKKLSIVLTLYAIFFSLLFLSKIVVFAQELTNVDEILGQIDLSALEELYNGLSKDQQALLGNSLKDFLEKIINGDIFKIEGILGIILALGLSLFKDLLPTFFIVFIILILSVILNGVKPDFANKSITNILSFAAAIIIGGTLCYSIFQLILEISTIINRVSNLVQVVFPIIFSILVTMGATTSVAILQGGVSIYLSFLTVVIDSFIIPLSLSACILSIVTNLSQSFKLDHLPLFISNCAKKVLNVIFVVFFSIISLQGISSQAYDSVAIRVTKFSLSKYIPFLGGYLSTGFDYLYSGSVILKNTLGVAFLVLLLLITLPIIVRLIFIKWFSKLLSSISLFLENKSVSKMLDGVNSSVSLIITSIVGVVLSLVFFCLMIILSFNSLI